MEGVLDWDAPELLTLLFIDQWNGFGFQCDKEQEAKPCRIYIARIYKEESFDEAKFLEQIRPKYTNQEVWITDFLGYDFLTVSTAMFKRIPEVINDCLIFGYSILTHTCVKAFFTPGMVFNQRNFELGLIHTVNENYRLISEIKEIKDIWGYLKKILKLGPLKREFNWTTEEGKAFCRELRLKLRSKRPVTRCFNHFEKHKDVCQKYGIFGYEENNKKLNSKRNVSFVWSGRLRPLFSHANVRSYVQNVPRN